MPPPPRPIPNDLQVQGRGARQNRALRVGQAFCPSLDSRTLLFLCLHMRTSVAQTHGAEKGVRLDPCGSTRRGRRTVSQHMTQNGRGEEMDRMGCPLAFPNSVCDTLGFFDLDSLVHKIKTLGSAAVRCAVRQKSPRKFHGKCNLMGARQGRETGSREFLRKQGGPFFLLRTALKDRPRGPPTANRQLPPTASRHQPPTANRQPRPTVNRCQPPPTTHHQLPTAANRRQPPIANRQPAISTSRQPPIATNHG